MTTTRETARIVSHDGAWSEVETAALSSVEYTVDSKGVIKPSVKAYHADVMEAERLASEALKAALARVIKGEFP